MRLTAALIALLLVACAPRYALQGVDPQRPPASDTWGPQPAPLEWWYVSGYLPEEGLAFHWAFFKAFTPQDFRLGNFQVYLLAPGPFHASHIAVTDLRANRKIFEEKFDALGPAATVSYPPLRLEHENWKFWQEGGAYLLEAGPLSLRLTPLKPSVVHPPGYSGTAETGRMYYVSYTRMRLEGRISGREVRGEAWMDHQWGEQIGNPASPTGIGALWDWFGLHLSDGSDLMLYRVKNTAGEVVQLAGSRITPDGKAEEVRGLEMTPHDTWTSPSGRTYTLNWRVQAEGLNLSLRALRADQELLTASTRVAYWEGPVAGEGTWQGQPIQARGMGELVAGAYDPQNPQVR